MGEINIFNGDSAAGAWREAFQANESMMLISRDVLSCGPLHSFEGMDAWKELRQKYWETVCFDNCEEMRSFDTFQRDFYHRFEEVELANRCNLWIGTSLSDQLLLAFIVFLFDFYGLDLTKLRIFQFTGAMGANGKSFSVQGIGLLRPSQIIDHPDPYALSKEQVQRTKSAWESFASDDPRKYLEFMSGKVQNSPLLYKAMSYVFYRYPKVDNGLSFWEETILRNTPKEMAIATKTIVKVFGDSAEVLDLTGDWYLFSRLKNLAMPELNQPLIRVEPWDKPMRESKVEITAFGKMALENKVNVIEENGIDDWVGGVHLDSKSNNLWVRDGNQILPLGRDLDKP